MKLYNNWYFSAIATLIVAGLAVGFGWWVITLACGAWLAEEGFDILENGI